MDTAMEAFTGGAEAEQKTSVPTVAVMGEFSSGKSSLINLLLNQPMLPTQVTSTQVPAVLLRHGPEPKATALNRNGTVDDVGDQDPFTLDYDTYALVRAHRPAPVLEHLTIIDTPGISDPLVTHSALEEYADLADMVLWCTHATQAWRESENAFWRTLPERLHKTSILVVTRADLLSPADISRVRNRLVQETGGLFRKLVFLSALQAKSALTKADRSDEDEVWSASGGRALLTSLGLTQDQIVGRSVYERVFGAEADHIEEVEDLVEERSVYDKVFEFFDETDEDQFDALPEDASDEAVDAWIAEAVASAADPENDTVEATAASDLDTVGASNASDAESSMDLTKSVEDSVQAAIAEISDNSPEAPSENHRSAPIEDYGQTYSDANELKETELPETRANPEVLVLTDSMLETPFQSPTEVKGDGVKSEQTSALRLVADHQPASDALESEVSNSPKEGPMATDISALKEINGFVGACLVDSDTGLMLGSEGGGEGFDLEAAAAGNTEVVKAKLSTMSALGLSDSIEDMLITLGTQYHLIRPLEDTPTVFIYVALDKKTSNLGLARIQVKKVESTVSI